MPTDQLTDQYIANTYKGLIHARGESLPLSGTQVFYDGDGHKTALALGRESHGLTVTGNISTNQYLSAYEVRFPRLKNAQYDVVYQTDSTGVLALTGIEYILGKKGGVTYEGTVGYITTNNGLVTGVSAAASNSSIFSLASSVTRNMFPGTAGIAGTWVSDLITYGPSATITLPWDASVSVTYTLNANGDGGRRTYTSVMLSNKQYGPVHLFPASQGQVAALEIAGEGTSASVTLCIDLAQGTHIAKFGSAWVQNGLGSVDFASISWIAHRKTL